MESDFVRALLCGHNEARPSSLVLHLLAISDPRKFDGQNQIVGEQSVGVAEPNDGLVVGAV